jgi:hypothetical protein
MATLSDRRFTTPDGAKQMKTRGALSGQLADSGSDDNFIKQTREQVTQGTSALSRLTSGAVRDYFAEALKGQPFEISSMNLPKEKEDELTGGIVMLGRERREERHDEPAAGNAPGGAPGGGEHRYQMREKLASIGDDFWIENGAGQRAYKVDGKALRVRDTLKIRDMQGNEVAEIQEKLVTVRDTMDIARNG